MMILFSKKSKFKLTRSSEAYLQQINSDGSILNWMLLGAYRGNSEIRHLEPDWRVGDELELKLIDKERKGRVEKRIVIEAIQQED